MSDPRSWSREDVGRWLGETASWNSLPFVSPDSFKMNGKGLSMLTMEGFSARASCGGKTLFKEILTCNSTLGAKLSKSNMNLSIFQHESYLLDEIITIIIIQLIFLII